jgi:hypothetical protein
LNWKFSPRAGNSRLETYTQNNPIEYYWFFGLLWIIVDYFVDNCGFFIGLLDYFGLFWFILDYFGSLNYYFGKYTQTRYKN